MKTIITLLLILIIPLLILNSESTKRDKKPKTVMHSIYDSVYCIDIIPDSALYGIYNNLVYNDILRFNSTKKDGFQINWEALIHDGSYSLRVNKRQIVLLSTHENPNPNELYWFVNISEDMYWSIKKYFDKHRKDFKEYKNKLSPYYYYRWLKFTPELPIPEEWTDENMKIHDEDSEKKLYKNFSRLIELFNIPLKNKIIIPNYNDFISIKRIRVVSGEFELE